MAGHHMAAFSSKDLALMLPDQVGDAFTMKHTVDNTALKAADVKGFQPKLDSSKKVSRLRAGQAPDAVDAADYEDDDDAAFDFGQGKAKEQAAAEAAAMAAAVAAGRRRPSRWDAASNSGALPAPVTWANPEDAEVDEEEPARRRPVAAAILEEEAVEGDVAFTASVKEVSEDEDEDAIAARRAKVRERLRRRQEEEEEEEEEQVPAAGPGLTPGAEARARQHRDDEEEDVVEDKDEGGDGSSEYETYSEEEEEEDELLKPVFVHKTQRATIAEVVAQEKKDAEKAKKAEATKKQRAQETRGLVAEQIKREADQAVSKGNMAGHDSDTGLPDDVDDLECPVEFEAWRLREVQRLARDRKERHAFEGEKAETERRRGLTEAQRAAEDLASGKGQEKEKEKWKFMQKYYHKGAFYMDESAMADDDVRKRVPTDQATLDDKFDKASMPKVMQVKKFGFASQTKYTHLKDQDTTDYDSAWMMDTGKRKAYDSKLSGLGDIDTAGRKRPKKPS